MDWLNVRRRKAVPPSPKREDRPNGGTRKNESIPISENFQRIQTPQWRNEFPVTRKAHCILVLWLGPSQKVATLIRNFKDIRP